MTINDLYETYPNFYIDVKREQELLAKADILMLQHPFYWYSMPPLLKAWQDDVLEIGYAYGQGGTALRDKEFLLSITAGGPTSSYNPSGYNKFEIDQFFPPYIQTANLCGMKWLEPLVLNGSVRATNDQLEAHAEFVRERLVSFSNESFQNQQEPMR